MSSAEHKEQSPQGNVPNLRFPEFSGEWKSNELHKVASLSKGTGISKDQLSDSGHPCILYGELYTKYKSEIIREVYSKTQLDVANLVKSHTNDVIIPCSGEAAIEIATARCVLIPDVLLGGDLNIIRLNGRHDGGFFAYQLNGKRKVDIAKVAQGVSVVHLYGEHLKKVKVSYPSLKEQQKISSFLALLDERIATQIKIIEDLKKLKSAISNEIFEQTSNRICELKEIASVIMGQSPSSHAYNNNAEGLPLIQGNLDIENGQLSPRIYTHEITQTCECGDVILTVRAPVGEIAIAQQEACIGRGVCSIRPHVKNDTNLIYQFLQYFKPKWGSLEQGSTFTAVSGTDIRGIAVSIPSADKIELLNVYDNKIRVESRILTNLTQQKQYLLAQMFI